MTAFPHTVTTDRLQYEPVDADRDLDGFAPLFADPRIADRMWPAHLGGPRTREETHGWLARMAAHWTSFGFGPWTARERDGGAVVAFVGLGYTVVAGAAEVEVGAVVAPDRWGQGYAAEGVDAAVEHAPSVRGLTSVVAFCEPVNTRAEAVIDRCGFTYERDTVVVELAHRLYRRAAVRRVP